MNSTVSVHRVVFETNRSTGEWRARCVCGWSDTQPDAEAIGRMAARHAEEWDSESFKRATAAAASGRHHRNFSRFRCGAESNAAQIQIQRNDATNNGENR